MAKQNYSFGLDIGTSAIKLVKLEFTADSVNLTGFSLQAAAPGINEAVRNIAQGVDTKKVNFSVSGQSTVIRYINLPRMNETELKAAMSFEAQKHIPFPLQEVNYDACILKEEPQAGPMLVLLAAVKKDFLSERIKVIEEAGLKPEIADIDSLALVNIFNFTYIGSPAIQNKALALLNIGSSQTNLTILENTFPYMSRDIHIAGNNFTQKVADTLGLDFPSAEKLKLDPPKEKLQNVIAAVESVLAGLASEIRTSFDYYESQRASSVTRIFLSGGSAGAAGLKDALANILGLEVEAWDPLSKIGIADNLNAQEIKGLSSQLAVAIGLALRGIK
ncbi:MAG: type IV pilus assembly protein PilM [Candidatus Omnitrophota bacterium]